MTNYLTTIFSLVLFCTTLSLNAQFNTLTYTAADIRQNTHADVPKKQLKHIEEMSTRIFMKPALSKKKLQRENDSLKSVIHSTSKTENQPLRMDMRRIEDSLIAILKRYTVSFKKRPDLPQQRESTFFTLDKLSMPLKNAFAITSGFGFRRHPIFGTVKAHNGIDIKASYENVYAVMDGIVTEAGWDAKGGGKYIKVRHHNRFETAYLHLSESYYKAGEKVKAGYIIAKSGNSGNSTGPHLHFSVREYGKYIDPLSFLNDLTLTKQLLAQHYGTKDTTHQ